MSVSKILKAKCSKTGNLFAMELKRIGLSWRVVNFIRLSPDEASHISSEIRQPEYYTNDNLLPCLSCGKRKVAGCNCSRKKHQCSSAMKYQFDCIYCESLSIDYSARALRSPYTKWAGISNIPDCAKDRYGNPDGSQYDLAQDGSFSGYTIVLLNLCIECDFSQPEISLKKKGFRIVEYKTTPAVSELQQVLNSQKTQLWIVSDRCQRLNSEHVELVAYFFEKGHGVYIWGDNDPYYVDANILIERLFGTRMYGDRYGDCVLGIQKKRNSSGIIPNHPITTGIVNFYEGKTIAQIDNNQILTPLIYGSECQVVAAYYDRDGRRALVDGGFTRLYYKWDSAGTDRYVVNAAAWLANIEHFGY